MTALYLFGSTFALVFFLGMQSLAVNGGHRWLAFWVGNRGVSVRRAVGDCVRDGCV